MSSKQKILIIVGQSGVGVHTPRLIAFHVMDDEFVKVSEKETEYLTDFAIPINKYISKLQKASDGKISLEIKSAQRIVVIWDGRKKSTWNIKKISATELSDLYGIISQLTEEEAEKA